MKEKTIWKPMAILLAVILCFSFHFALPVSADYENTHVNTGNQATDLVEVARTQVGYHEGTNNYTKYNVWFGSLNGYGYNYAWCQTFVAWCANQAGIPTSMIPRVSGTVSGMDFFKKNGTWKDAGITPEKGDIIYLHSKSSSGYHVGIVADVSGGQISTIEGNSSDRVAERTYSVGNSSIVGYGCPEYVGPNPTWAKVTLNQNAYMVGENVTFNLSSDYGKIYTIGIDDANGNRIDTYDTKESSYTRTFNSPGQYSCYVTTYNGVGLTDSERIYFEIYNEKPKDVSVSLSQNCYVVGENVTFNYSSKYGFGYTIGIDDANRNRIDTYDTKESSYTRTFNSPGQYSCYVTTYNGVGLTDSERIYFKIVDKCDINIDFSTNLNDVVFLQKILLRQTVLTADQAQLADYNGDGNINVLDLMLLKRALLS